MDWGFLAEFWNSITSQTLNAWEYTSDWFKQIGLAVAGAIGSLFDFLIHYISDFFIWLGWLFYAIKELFLAILLPIGYLTGFLKGFITNIIKTPIVPETPVVDPAVIEVFETLPYFSLLSQISGYAIIFIIGIGIIYFTLKI